MLQADREPEEDEDDGSRSSRDEDDGGSAAREDLEERLTTQQVSRTVRRYRRRLAECRALSDLPSGEVLSTTVTMNIQGSGRVSSASADASGDAENCIVGVVRDMSFPEFSGSPMEIAYPFRLR